MNIIKKSVGSRIRELRKDKQMTLKDFSQSLDMPISTINSWERGANIPSIQNLKLLSDITGVDSNRILYGDIADYLQDVFDYYNLNEIVNEDNFFELEEVLKGMNYKAGDFKLLKNTIKDIFPNVEKLINDKEEDWVLSPYSLNKWFPILEDYDFQREFLPLLQWLLSNENKERNKNEILVLLDVLSKQKL